MVIARIGGDKFMAILPDCETDQAALFKKRLENLISFHNEQVLEAHLKISVSSGFAVTERQIETIESLMQQADDLMYREKREKREEREEI